MVDEFNNNVRQAEIPKQNVRILLDAHRKKEMIRKLICNTHYTANVLIR